MFSGTLMGRCLRWVLTAIIILGATSSSVATSEQQTEVWSESEHSSDADDAQPSGQLVQKPADCQDDDDDECKDVEEFQPGYIETCIMNPHLCEEILELLKRAHTGFSSWGGKRTTPFQSWGGKRATPFQSWGGKRGTQFQSWGGKRTQFKPWGGKRTTFQSWGGKRIPFQSWGGKRTTGNVPDLTKKVTFNSWGGKRGDFSSWGGKRSLEEPRDKRATPVSPRAKINRLSAGAETVAIRRGTVDFFPWGGKRNEKSQ